MTDDLTPEDEDTALAAEYALGLLTSAEAAAFEQRLAVDPAFRALYAAWTAHFAAMMDNVAPVTPPAHVRPALESRLFGAARRGARLWAILAGAVVTATVALVALNLDRLTPLWSPDAPELVAQLASEDGGTVILASFDAVTGTLTLDRTTGTVAEGRSQELWLITDTAPAPISLGLMSTDPVTTLTPPAALIPVLPGATLAITDEPPGGSPPAGPVGPVLAAGVVTDS